MGMGYTEPNIGTKESVTPRVMLAHAIHKASVYDPKGHKIDMGPACSCGKILAQSQGKAKGSEGMYVPGLGQLKPYNTQEAREQSYGDSQSVLGPIVYSKWLARSEALNNPGLSYGDDNSSYATSSRPQSESEYLSVT
ncbi:MAG: hypothetical protein ACE5ES_05040 [Candidatus Nanoarchaeia archaeon]